MNCEWRWRRDSNPCKRLCRPVPSRSATPPCGLTPRAKDPPKRIPTLERMTRLELATPTLARLCATNCATSAFRTGSPRHLNDFSRLRAECKTRRAPRVSRSVGSKPTPASGMLVEAPRGDGRLAQLVARFLHTEEVISSSLVSPTITKPPVRPGVSPFQPVVRRHSEPAALLREEHRLLTGVERELGQDGRDVVAHRPRRQRQRAGDLPGGLAPPTRAQHVEFAIGQG